jgi:hypothetical protein
MGGDRAAAVGRNPVLATHRRAYYDRLLVRYLRASTDAGGDVSFTFKPGKKVTVGQRITATASDLEGNTSEFSTPRRVMAP